MESDPIRAVLCEITLSSINKNEVPNLNKRLWKLKAPLKIKVFLWYLRRGVILTKNNLAKHNWHGNKSCCFCHKPEIIKHLFFEYRFARRVWGVIFLAFGISPPSSVSNMFGSWLEGFEHNLRNIILLGAASTCWALWLRRNDIVFEKKSIYSPLQVIYAISHWLRTWAVLRLLVQVVKDFYFQAYGWRPSHRIDCH